MAMPFSDLLGRAGEAWGGLSGRERRLLSLLVGAAVLAVATLGLLSVRRTVKLRESSIAEKEIQLKQVSILASGFTDAEATRGRIEARIKGQPVRLFSYLDELAKKQGVAIGDLQDRGTAGAGEGITRSTVDINFVRIDLTKLSAFINEVEKSPHLVKIEKLRLRTRADDVNLLDASLTVSTYQLVQS